MRLLRQTARSGLLGYRLIEVTRRHGFAPHRHILPPDDHIALVEPQGFDLHAQAVRPTIARRRSAAQQALVQRITNFETLFASTVMLQN